MLKDVVCLAACAIALQAQSTPAEPPAIEAGFEQRVRNEDWNNILDYTHGLDDQREQIRYRSRAWLKLPLHSSIEFFAGINQETNQQLGKHNRFDEVVFENLYMDFKRLFLKGLSLRVGRQNLMRGEGFLLFEGTSGDGSRSIYFNAATLAYERRKSRLELIGILNPARERFLPAIHGCARLLQEWDEQALGLYYTDRNRKRTALDAYYFHKKEVNAALPKTHPQYQPDRHVSTAGARVVRQIDPRWSLTGEFAGQWGAQHGGREIRSYGGYGYVKRSFDRRTKPYFQAGYYVFSGDDPRTGAIENWDPIFSRWPKWSELYIYSQFREVGVAYWTNTSMWQAEAGLEPFRRAALRTTWYKMGAYHPFPGDPRIFGTGVDRGHMFQARFDYTFDRHWRGHALYEGLRAGDFYAAAHPAYFVRFEMSYQFTGHLPAAWLRH